MFEFLSKFEFLNKIFHRDESRKAAKDRLRLVIIQDRASMAPQMLENIKEDLIAVFSKYMEIDIKSVEIGLERRDGTVALAANIPVLRIRSVQTSGAPLLAAPSPPPAAPEEKAEKKTAAAPSRKSQPAVIRGRRERILKKRKRTGKSRKS